MKNNRQSTFSAIHQAADYLRRSRRTVVLTGAGISTPSGIPDFRSKNSGLWERFDPFEVASLTAFRYNPEKFYAWIRPLATQINIAQPNSAHIALSRLEEAGIIQAVITQNIDGLHQRAGSKEVVEVHGTWETMSCTSCFRSTPSSEYIQPFLCWGKLPICNYCGCILKPDLVLMGEQLPVHAWLKAVEMCRDCEVMLVIGSSLEVFPAASLPMRALENQARLLIINRTKTYVDVRADLIFREDLAAILPLIAEEIMGEVK